MTLHALKIKCFAYYFWVPSLSFILERTVLFRTKTYLNKLISLVFGGEICLYDQLSWCTWLRHTQHTHHNPRLALRILKYQSCIVREKIITISHLEQHESCLAVRGRAGAYRRQRKRLTRLMVVLTYARSQMCVVVCVRRVESKVPCTNTHIHMNKNGM